MKYSERQKSNSYSTTGSVYFIDGNTSNIITPPLIHYVILIKCMYYIISKSDTIYGISLYLDLFPCSLLPWSHVPLQWRLSSQSPKRLFLCELVFEADTSWSISFKTSSYDVLLLGHLQFRDSVCVRTIQTFRFLSLPRSIRSV